MCNFHVIRGNGKRKQFANSLNEKAWKFFVPCKVAFSLKFTFKQKQKSFLLTFAF